MMSYWCIDIEYVKEAIANPDSKKDAYEGKIRVTKKIGKKVIEVVFYKEAFRDKSNEYIVITAYYI